MKFLIPLLALSTIAFAEPNSLTDAEKAAGWRLLFDGKTTNGWVAIGKAAFPEKGWIVEDGTLKHVAKGGGGDIVTSENFDDFELEWEWRITPGANGGLKYNLVDPKKPVGCEYQMIDDTGHPDSKAAGGKRTTASLYDVLKPADDKKLKPVGEWNSSRIVVKGNHAEQWLNGAKTVEFEFGSDALKAAVADSKFKSTAGWGVKTKSPILIQDHGDEVALRSIKIRTPGGAK
jgi:3-keto-disaccharide hydrolase